jgi:DNA mismatch repair protein MutS2
MPDRKSSRRVAGKRPNPRARSMWAHSRKFREIDLHGMIVDDAIIRVSETITDAVKSREIRIRINHGKGTGTLRHEIRAMLRAHPAVRGYRPAPRETGGDGVTEVDLRV